MLFNSTEFFVFFPIVVIAYYIVPRKIRYILLLAASYYFYMSWNPKYIVLIISVTIVTFLGALLLERIKENKTRKVILFLCTSFNLSILFLFKYFDFFINNLNKILGHFNGPLVYNVFSFVLPVGISFYTFQGLSYLFDVYKGEIYAEKNFLRYALFVSFFPQLVAGPIERSKNLLRQINTIDNIKFDYNNLVYGTILIWWGLFQKIVIADRIAIYVNSVFDNLYRCGTIETFLGMIAFSLQIYCDFGGYSSIAIGAARIMGINLIENFSAPYLSESIADFWRNWHISLSTWFRDYVYIPLGGNRNGKKVKYRNLIVTFLISGLWHGANWTFVVWGALHAFLQIVEDICKPLRKKICMLLSIDTEVFSYHFGNAVKTFLLTSFAWIFFRATGLRQAVKYIKILFTRWNPWVLFDESIFSYGIDRREFTILLFAIILLVIVDVKRKKNGTNIADIIIKQNYLFRLLVVTALIITTIVYGKYGIEFDSAKFIYFDF